MWQKIGFTPGHWSRKTQSKDSWTYMAFHHGAAGKCRTVEDVATLSAVNVVSPNNINNVDGEVKQKENNEPDNDLKS